MDILTNLTLISLVAIIPLALIMVTTRWVGQSGVRWMIYSLVGLTMFGLSFIITTDVHDNKDSSLSNYTEQSLKEELIKINNELHEIKTQINELKLDR